MFFSQPPSKLELARRAASDAAKSAGDAAKNVADSAGSLAGSATSILGTAAHSAADTAQSLAQSAAGSAQSLAQSAATSAQSLAQGAATSAQSLAQTAGKGAATATDVLSSKANALLHRGGDTVVGTAKIAAKLGETAPLVASDSVEAARVKALAAQKSAEVSARDAEANARDAQKQAEVEMARSDQQLAENRAEFEAQQKTVEARQGELDAVRADAARQAEEIHLRRSAPVQLDVEELQDADLDYGVVTKKKRGFSIWTLLGGALLVGAAVYFLMPKSGRRSRAAIKDRLNKVKGDLVDKTTSAADAASDQTKAITDSATTTADSATTTVETLPAPTTPAPTTMVVESYTVTTDSVEGAAIEGARTARIETAGTVAESGDGPQHPNIFDKVAGVVGSAADATEHFAGDAKDDAVQNATGVSATPSEGAKKSSKKAS